MRLLRFFLGDRLLCHPGPVFGPVFGYFGGQKYYKFVLYCEPFLKYYRTPDGDGVHKKCKVINILNLCRPETQRMLYRVFDRIYRRNRSSVPCGIFAPYYGIIALTSKLAAVP